MRSPGTCTLAIVMRYVVLESFLGSQYDDSPSAYEFPQRYLRHFEALQLEEPVFALIYEPRGDVSAGRMAYVGFAMITQRPAPTGRRNRAGEKLWRVEYDQRAYEFNRAVPREILGEPLESTLRDLPRGRLRNVATFGRAVRPVSDADALRIIDLGHAQTDEPEVIYPLAGDVVSVEEQVRERTERLVTVVQRDAQFRDNVLVAYGHRCAVSGFTIGPEGPARLAGLIDAAHIRAVWQNGPDSVTNGLALTPTLHRLLDVGLFTLRYEEERIAVRVSPRLHNTMIAAPDRSFQLPLRDGLRLLLPSDPRRWPDTDQLQYHERRVFVAS